MNVNLAMKSLGGPVAMLDKAEEYYPEFHYRGDKELDIPDEGVMKIRFRKVSEEKRTCNGGEKCFSCSVEVQEILKVEGHKGTKPPATSGTAKNTEAALDKILEAVKGMGHSEETEDSHGY